MAAKGQPQQRWQLPVVQFLTLVLVTLLIVAFGNFTKTMLDNYRLRAEKATWEARIAQEEAEYARLLEQQVYVASDPYQRQLAHEMGFYAPDEHPLVLIVPPDLEDEVRAFDPVFREATPIETPNWQRWWDLFFGPAP